LLPHSFAITRTCLLTSKSGKLALKQAARSANPAARDVSPHAFYLERASPPVQFCAVVPSFLIPAALGRRVARAATMFQVNPHGCVRLRQTLQESGAPDFPLVSNARTAFAVRTRQVILKLLVFPSSTAPQFSRNAGCSAHFLSMHTDNATQTVLSETRIRSCNLVSVIRSDTIPTTFRAVSSGAPLTQPAGLAASLSPSRCTKQELVCRPNAVSRNHAAVACSAPRFANKREYRYAAAHRESTWRPPGSSQVLLQQSSLPLICHE